MDDRVSVRPPAALLCLWLALLLTAALLVVPPAAASGHGLGRDDAIPFDDAQDNLTSAVIEPSGDHAYYGTNTAPGQIVKVHLATFERVDTLTLDPGEDNLRSAVIDPAGEFAYFGTNTAPGQIVKVHLPTLTRVATIPLGSGENALLAAVIAPAGDFAYFGTNTAPGQIVKIDLATFTRVPGGVTLDSGEDNVSSAVIDPSGDFAYFGMGTTPGRVVKIDLATFDRAAAITMSNFGQRILTTAVIDPTGDFAYFGTGVPQPGWGPCCDPAGVVKIDLGTFTQVDGIWLQNWENRTYSAVMDQAGKYAYFGLGSSPGRVVKIDLSTFTRVGAVAMDSGENHLRAAVIAPSGDQAYFGTNTAHGSVVKVDLGTLTRVDAVALRGEDLPAAAVIDPAGDYAYFGTDTAPGQIVKVDLATFARVDALTLNPGEEHLVSAVMDPNGRHAYFGTSTSPGRVVKIDLATFTPIGDAITLDAGENSLFSAVIDPAGDYAYFGTRTAPGRVVKVGLDPFFAREDAITLDPGEDELVSAVIDPAGAHAYFGNTSTNPGKVVKVDVGPGTFARVDAVTLANDEAGLWAATIDPAGAYAYFGTISLGQVVKVDLGTTFSRDSAITLDPGEEMMTSAVMDPSGDFAYIGTGGAPGRVVEVDLGTFARTGAETLLPGEDGLWSAVIDPAGNYAYFGTQTAPGWAVKVDLGIAAPPHAPTNLAATPEDAEVDLSWDAPTTGGPVDDYLVEQSPDGTTWTAAAAPTATSVTVTGLTNGTAYHFRVRAEGPGGESAWEGPVQATPQATSVPPSPVTGLTASAGKGQVLLSWTPPKTAQAAFATASGGSVEHYRVQQSIEGGPWATVVTTTDNEVSITGLEDGVTYHFRVRAEGPGGVSDWAGPVSATPQDLPPTLVSDGEVVRLSGPDRFATGVDASAALWPDGASTVVIATGLDYPDALAAGPVAALHKAPLLLAATNHLPSAVRDELVRLAPTRVLLVGGAAALSAEVAEEAHALPSRPQVDRIAGSHRFSTAEAAAMMAGRSGDGDIVVATGQDYPDALSAGSLTAGDTPVPVTLALRDRLVTDLVDGERALLVGGTSVLSAGVEDEARRQAGAAQRLFGSQRFATSQAVADFALRHRIDGKVPLVVATGQNYPDALSAGAITARTGGPLLLIPATGPTTEQAEWITANHDRFTGAVVMGGPNAVTDGALRRLLHLLRPR